MKPGHFWRWAGAIGLLCLTLVALAAPTLAFESRGGETVVIAAGEVIPDDLMVAAGTFTLNGTVKGDVMAVGGTIEINGTVEGDLMACGQSIIINGVVADDARIAGQALTLGEGAEVGDDLMAAGFSLENKPGSAVGGSLMYAGYQALLSGAVTEDAEIAAGALELSGQVGGDVSAEVGEAEEGPSPAMFMQFMPNVPPMPSVPMGLTVREGARIGGELEYTSRIELSIPAGVVAGKITRHEPAVEVPEEVSRGAAVGLWFLAQLRTLVTLLLVGLLLVWAVPVFTKKVADAVQAKPLPSLGWGVVSIAAFFLALLIILIVVILLALLLGTLTLGDLAGTTIWAGLLALALLTFFFAIAVSYVTKVTVSFLGGRLILGSIKPAWGEGRVWPLVVGLVIFVLITAIPILGGLISLIVVLFGLGALWLLGREVMRRKQAVPAEA